MLQGLCDRHDTDLFPIGADDSDIGRGDLFIAFYTLGMGDTWLLTTLDSQNIAAVARVSGGSFTTTPRMPTAVKFTFIREYGTRPTRMKRNCKREFVPTQGLARIKALIIIGFRGH